MADDSKQPFSNLTGRGLLMLATLMVGSYFLFPEAPFQDSRPSVERSSPERNHSEQDINARLWEDPFAAIQGELRSSGAGTPCSRDDHCLSPFDRDPQMDDVGRVLIVTVPGSFYSEEKETRRQIRYAVLAGLDREGFIPQDSEHVGYFRIESTVASPDQRRDADRALPAESNEAARRTAARIRLARLPEIVPFETFRARSGDAKGILLLWFDEDAIAGQHPLAQIARLLCQAQPGQPDSGKRTIGVSLVGFNSSQALLQLARDDTGADGIDVYQRKECPHRYAEKGYETPWPDMRFIRFFAYGASVDSATLIHTAKSGVGDLPSARDQAHAYFARHNDIEFHRTITPDDVLARFMKMELKRRGILARDPEKNPTVALISEWDTFYGQSLPELFVHCIRDPLFSQCGGHQGPKDDIASRLREWPLQFRYLRGLDGQLPGNPAAGEEGENHADYAKGDSRKESDEGGKSIKARKTDTGSGRQERAEGNGQFDYLRRLSQNVRDMEREQILAGGPPIKAIGVLGSDVYDKLLVMQAMRQQFPGAMFFTTDLDARLLSPAELKWTRNLLISSSYDLRLTPAVLGGTPPFRRSYQASAFLAARLALTPPAAGDKERIEIDCSIEIGLDRWLAVPRLFEIDRKGIPVPLPTGPVNQPDGKPSPDTCADNLLSCADIHPSIPPLYPAMRLGGGTFWAVSLGCAMLGIGWAAWLSPLRPIRAKFEDWIDRAGSIESALARAGVVALAAAAIFATGGVAIAFLWDSVADLLTGHGEGHPVAIANGISIWVPTMIRLVSIVVSVWLLFDGLRLLNRNIRDIARELKLVRIRNALARQLYQQVGKTTPWRRFVSYFSYRLEEPENVAGVQPGVVRFWTRYVYQGRKAARSCRIAACWSIAVLFFMLLYLLLGSPPLLSRGAAARDLFYLSSVVDSFALLALTFFVVDATIFCCVFVRHLRKIDSGWPPSALAAAGANLAAGLPCIEEWIDLRFVARRTDCIGKLIYRPFAILALMILTRSPIFADYPPNLVVLLIQGINISILLICAVLLQLAAEKSRTSALRKIDEGMIAACLKPTGNATVAQLGILRRMVETLDEGAFGSLSQQSFVKAVLLPLSSYGGTLLLEAIF